MIGSGQEAAPIALRAFFARLVAGFAVVAVVADFDQRAEVDAVARLAFVLLKLRADAAKGENGQGRVGAVAVSDVDGAERAGLPVGLEQAFLPIGLGFAVFGLDLSGGEFGKAFAAYAQQQNGVLAHGVFSRFSSISRAGWREKA